MLNKQAKAELLNAILALDKAKEAKGLESLQTSADEFSAMITRAQKTSLQSQFSEFKKHSDQKMNKMLQAIVSLSQKQFSDKISKFTSFSSLSSTSVTSEADKNKSTKTAETFTKTTKPAEAVVSQTKVTYALKAAENTQQTDQAWSTVNKQKKTAPSFSKTAKKTAKVTTRDRRLLIATTETKNFKLLYVRNQVNEALQKANIKNLLVVRASLSMTQNSIIFETAVGNSAEQLLQKKSVWQHLLPSSEIRKDEKWAKIIAHDISTEIFNKAK
ncbi:MAG: hypothetical protein M1812_008509, partial [Candelaria pacifica]